MRARAALLVLALTAYAALAGYQLELPGLNNDESQEAGLLAVQLVNGLPISAFRGVGLGTRNFPLMVQDYIGAFNVYLTAPFVALFGPGPVSVRLAALLIGLITLVATFGFMRAAFGASAGLIATWLLAINPSFVFWSRQGVLVASLTLTLTVTLLWVATRWGQRGGPRLAFVGGLVAGLGVYAKLLFVWVIAALAGTWALVHLPAAARLARGGQPTATRPFWPRRPTRRDALAAIGGLLLGVLPLLAYNLLSGGTVFTVGANLSTSYYGVDNLAVGENLATRWDQFRAVIAGRDHFWYLGGSAGNPWWEWALLAAALYIVYRAAARRPRSRRALTLLLVLVLGLSQTVFTVTGLFPHHFAVFTPLWVAVVAAATQPFFDAHSHTVNSHLRAESAEPGRMRRRTADILAAAREASAIQPRAIGAYLVAIALLALAGRDLAVDFFYHRALAASGGLGTHSDAIYRLVDELEAREATLVVALDWGIAPQVRQLTEERIVPQEAFGYSWEPPAEFAAQIAPLLGQPGALFVFHWPNETIFPRREAFAAQAAAGGFVVEPVAIISRRDGAPVFEIVMVHSGR